MIKEITVDEFKKLFSTSKNNLEIIDVRQPYEYNQIRISWSKLIPLQEITSNLDAIDWSKLVVFVCRSWARSAYVTQVLSQSWYNWINLQGWINLLTFNCRECMEQWIPWNNDFNNYQ